MSDKLDIPPSCTDSGFRLRVHYYKLLYPYESKFYRGVDVPVEPPKPKASRVRQKLDSRSDDSNSSKNAKIQIPVFGKAC